MMVGLCYTVLYFILWIFFLVKIISTWLRPKQSFLFAQYHHFPFPKPSYIPSPACLDSTKPASSCTLCFPVALQYNSMEAAADFPREERKREG